MATVAERVQAGIELLDKNGPVGWRSLIRLREFNICNPCRCVLGFLYDHFSSGHYLLKLDFKSVVAYGFDAVSDRDQISEDMTIIGDYEALQAEWIRRLSIVNN